MKRSDPSGQLPEQLPDDLATLWYLVRRVAGLIDRQGDALCRRELGISFTQFLVLSVVDAYPGPLSQQAVADRLGLTKGTVSRQLDAAVAAGLMSVDIAAHTRRENAVALTRAGTTVVRKGDKLLESSRAAMLAAVPSEELPVALHVLQALLRELEGPGDAMARGAAAAG